MVHVRYGSAVLQRLGGGVSWRKYVYLWCGWHVDRAWRDALKRYFHKKEEQKELYRLLRVLMMETNKAIFMNLLIKFLTLSTNVSPTFVAEYFKTTYCSHIEQWATYYRIHRQS